MHFKAFISILFLFSFWSVSAQSTSIYLSHYRLNQQTINNRVVLESSYYIQNIIMKQGIGVLHQKRKITYYGELTYVYNYYDRIDENEVAGTKRNYSRSPKIDFGINLGLGKSFQINQQLKYHLISYFGYNFESSKKHNHTYIYPQNKAYPIEKSHFYSPNSHTLLIGSKAMFEYQVAKHWALGLSLDCSIFYQFSDDEVSSEDKRYNYSGELLYIYKQKATHNLKSLNTSFSQFGIYLNYTINKK